MLGYTFLACLQAQIPFWLPCNLNFTKEDVASGLLDAANEVSLGNDLFRQFLSAESCLNTEVS
jgi:hypothetical protein